jgi:hypothetical protein
LLPWFEPNIFRWKGVSKSRQCLTTIFTSWFSLGGFNQLEPLAGFNHFVTGHLLNVHTAAPTIKNRVGKFLAGKSVDQGCQMVSFQAKNPDFGKIWRSLDIFNGHLEYFTDIWDIL